MPMNKLKMLFKIIKHNGGVKKSLYKFWRTDTLKYGVFVGEDKYGNKYYMNDYYQFPRNRWVDYNIAVRWNMDASQICPEWFGWIHHRTDCLPCQDSAKVCIETCPTYLCWLQPHQENFTGTNRAYYPYSTTRPNICAWDGTSMYDAVEDK